MQKSEFPKMRHYVGFWQIGSHLSKVAMYVSANMELQEVFGALHSYSQQRKS